jgi:outer membrane protein OmpA-like peptidoglycan-associated protein
MDATDSAFPVLLNGQRVTLPAVRCKGTEKDGSYGIEYLLDDDKMPLILWAPNGQTTEINYPPPTKAQPGGGGSQAIEQALKKEGHVDVYGIYFDFASDKLRPESAPVLAEIASVLKNNPTWKLHVNGHTDNIGGDAYNLDLSNRRAAAVKQALVTQYQIDPARLDPQGFGATQPKESNDTLAGRARNRRVELIRE